MRRMLVTGAAGFIGYHVARRLAETNRCEVLGVDNLSAYYDVELKRARRELRDNLAQRLGQTVWHHLEMVEMSRRIAFEKELKNRSAGVDIQIECSVYEFELPRATGEQSFKLREQSRQRDLAHRDIEG